MDNVTAPVSELLCVRVIEWAPAVKLDVPGTVRTPDCVIAPPAVIETFPLFVSVNAGNAIAAPLNTSVILRKLDKLARFVGNAALALVLRNPISRKLPSVPAKVIAVDPKSLAYVFNNTSEPDAVTVIDVAAVPPVAVMAPFCVIAPPADKVMLRPMVDAANSIAPEVVRLTS